MKHDIPELDERGLRNFGLTSGALIAALFGLVLPWLFDRAYPWWPWLCAALLGVWALALPSTLGSVYRLWMKFGYAVGRINTMIILTVLFYIVFLPVALIMKILGRDAMSRTLDPRQRSYRVESARPGKEHFERPY